jgi:hypothetical protein
MRGLGGIGVVGSPAMAGGPSSIRASGAARPHALTRYGRVCDNRSSIEQRRTWLMTIAREILRQAVSRTSRARGAGGLAAPAGVAAKSGHLPGGQSAGAVRPWRRV